MLDRVIDGPAHQGRTDLEQALAQAVREEHCFLSLACTTKSSSVFIFLGSRCLQSIERCGLLANSQSLHPFNHLGIRRDCAEPSGCAFAGTKPGCMLSWSSWQSSLKAVSSCHVDKSETRLKPAGLRNKACQFAGLHVVSNGQSSL